jgi:pimeloyl-ACP methyl ester carboxylesterase/bifunctional DNase/RNase
MSALFCTWMIHFWRYAMLAMQVADVVLRDSPSVSVFLVEDTQQIRLKFWTTYAGGEAILAALHQTPAIRPSTQVLFLDALKHFGISVSRATIDELRGGLLYAHLELQSSSGKSVTVEAMPSDAVAVALRAGVPLEISEQVVAEMGCRRGQLIDVGGYHLSTHVKGSRGPTVVLESGGGNGHETWGKVQGTVAQFTTVFSYDRAGLGWSDSAPAPRTFQDSVQDLHILLERLALPAPYVLVGHSAGGSLVRLYADCYPADVAGLVLVDSAHPDFSTRLLATLPPESADDPPSVRAFQKSLLSSSFPLEWDDATTCSEQVRACGELGSLPLEVITATKPVNPMNLPADTLALRDRVWLELQQDLAHLSSHSTHRFAEQSGHMVPLDQPEIVIGAIREMVNALR